MAQTLVIRYDNLNINDIIITAPKLNPKTKQMTAGIISAKTKRALYIETPLLNAQFGVSSYNPTKDQPNPDESKTTYSLPLSTSYRPNDNNVDETDEIRGQKMLFEEVLKPLDEKMIQFAVDHSQELFKKKCSKEVVEMLYTRAVKPNVKDDEVYPDRINVKLMKNDAGNGPDSSIKFFKTGAEEVVVDSWDALKELIPAKSQIRAILQPRVYFIAGKFGINFKMIQLKVPNVTKIGRPVSYAFSDEPDEVNTSTTTNARITNNAANDSDYEDVDCDNDDESSPSANA